MPAPGPYGGKEAWTRERRRTYFGYHLAGPSVCVPPGTVFTNTLTIDDGYHPPFVRSAQVAVDPGPTPWAACTGHANAHGNRHGDDDHYADIHDAAVLLHRYLPLILRR